MTNQTFEAMCAKAPFAELIRLGISLAAWAAQRRDRTGGDCLSGEPALSR